MKGSRILFLICFLIPSAGVAQSTNCIDICTRYIKTIRTVPFAPVVLYTLDENDSLVPIPVKEERMASCMVRGTVYSLYNDGRAKGWVVIHAMDNEGKWPPIDTVNFIPNQPHEILLKGKPGQKFLLIFWVLPVFNNVALWVTLDDKEECKFVYQDFEQRIWLCKSIIEPISPRREE